jgi:hypothetical protein
MTNFSPSQQAAAQELLIRRRARANVLDYANAIDIPGRPISEDPDTEFFEPIETTMAPHHRLILETMDRISKTPHGRAMFFEVDIRISCFPDALPRRRARAKDHSGELRR